MRKLLVPFGPTEAERRALRLAFSVAKDFSAHVDVLHVRPNPQDAVPLLGEGVSGAMVEELISLTEQEAAARAAQARDAFDEQRRRDDLAVMERPSADGSAPHAPSTRAPSTRWLDVVGREEDIAVEHGHVSDLIVVGQGADEDATAAAATLRASLFESGRPVLLAPAESAARCGKRIAVAWNASAEASRCVGAALPFLVQAEAVLVFTAGSERTIARSAEGLVDWLAWHGIGSEIGILPEGRGTIGEALLDAAAAANVDLLVMGAYTHSRLRQLILGGVTSYVLEHARTPLLMAH